MTTSPTPAPLSARMTLDGAIAHADEVAQACGPCAAEHRQLAEWLRDYRTLTATLTEWEIAADEGYGDSMVGVQITPDWLRARKAEWEGRRSELTARVAELEAERDACAKEARRQAYLKLEERSRATQAEAERDALQAALAAAEAREQALREAARPIVAAYEAVQGTWMGKVSDDVALTWGGITAGQMRALVAALSGAQQAPEVTGQAQGGDIARELAEALDENWPFLAVWAQQYGRDTCGGKMHRGHAEMLASVHSVMTKAHAAGLIKENTTTRLPVLIAEAGHDVADLLAARASGLLPTETREAGNG